MLGLGLPEAKRVELFGTRYYQMSEGTPRYPSVTTVLKASMRPDLVDWYARCAARRALECVQAEALPTLMGERKQAIRDIVEDASGAADRERDFHANVGDIFHEFMWTGEIDQVLLEPLPHKFRVMVDRLAHNWATMLQRWHVFPILTEFPLIHPYYEYGGTLDALVEDESGTRIMLEVKTSRSLDYSHPVQASAYAKGLELLEVPFDKVAVLRVDKYKDDAFDYRIVDCEKAFPVFEAAAKVYKASEELWDNSWDEEGLNA